MSTEISPNAASHSGVSTETSEYTDRDRASQVFRNLTGAAGEAIDSILWRLKAKLGSDTAIIFGVTGGEKHSGTSTIAHALAARAGQQTGTRVLLIDATGNQAQQSGGEQVAGLGEIMAGEIAPLECQVTTPYENVDLIGMDACNALATGVEERFIAEMLHEYASHYDMIVVDLPVAGELKKVLPLAKHLPGVLLVVRSENAKHSQTQQAVDQLTQDGVSIFGTVLNGYRNSVPQWLRKWF